MGNRVACGEWNLNKLMYKITTAENKLVEVNCIGCAIAKKEIEVIGGIIAETENFNVSNDLECPIPGFLILASNHHIRSVAEFTPDQVQEFSMFLYKLRKAMTEVLDIDKITIVQEERSADSHFHLWLFPWHDWMYEIGKDISDIRKIMELSKENYKTPENLGRIRYVSELLKNSLIL